MSALPHGPEAEPAALPIVVLDTNVLLFDPAALRRYDDHEVVIPITVIEEIDRFKKDLNETGRNARSVSRALDAMRAEGSLQRGVRLPRGGLLRVSMGAAVQALPEGFGPRTADNVIIATVLGLAQSAGAGRVTLVTRDTNMRLKADALGLRAEDYREARIDVDERYTGVAEQPAPADEIAGVYQRGWAPLSDEDADRQGVHPNQFLVLKADDGGGQSAVVRYDRKQARLRLVGKHKEGVWGLFARNKEQLFALDLLLDESVSLVTLDGVAGTGKTLLAIACGLKLVADDKLYRRLVVSRPIFPLGKDIGFLPGDLSEKLNPWMKPIFDNLELLLGNSREKVQARPRVGRDQTPDYQPLIDQGLIEVEPLTYIRGRSMPRQFLIVDEAQNLTPHEVKTVLTRAGEGTKVVLTGDPMQIDNPYVDASSNGLTYVVERFKGSPAAGHVTLRKGERSELAELAATLL